MSGSLRKSHTSRYTGSQYGRSRGGRPFGTAGLGSRQRRAASLIEQLEARRLGGRRWLGGIGCSKRLISAPLQSTPLQSTPLQSTPL